MIFVILKIDFILRIGFILYKVFFVDNENLVFL